MGCCKDEGGGGGGHGDGGCGGGSCGCGPSERSEQGNEMTAASNVSAAVHGSITTNTSASGQQQVVVIKSPTSTCTTKPQEQQTTVSSGEEFIPRHEIWLDEALGEKLINKSASLCPSCLKLVPMIVFEKDQKVLLRKTCKEHGTIQDVYWGDYEMFVRAKRFEVKGRGLENPQNPEEHPICPRSCGLCSMHETHSGLTNIVITNRCDLTCWYCFFYAEKAGYIYEPTMEELRKMVRMMRSEQPMAGNAVQLTGGNPELRDDLPEIIEMIKEEGCDHIQLNTNATYRLWKDVEFAKRIRKAGVNTFYFSFDGVSPKTNPKNFWEVPGVLKTAREAGIGIVLVPTCINTVNDHEIGDIFKFGLKNIDIVRGVNYQPVSLVGRMPTSERNRFRITIPDVIKRLEEQVGIPRDAFYPVPCTTILSNFIEALAGRPKYELSINPACGMATYIFKEGDRIIPITDFVDVDGLFEYIKEKTMELREGKNKFWVLAKLMSKLGSFVDKEKGPTDIDLAKIIFNVMLKKDYKSLGVFHKKSLFVGMMHFQDLYNWDIQRIKKCDIHYATPDGIIPFCTFNVIPQWYRDKIQKQYGETIEQWQTRIGKTLKEGYHKRDPAFMRTLPKNLLDLPVPTEAELAAWEAARAAEGTQVEHKPQAAMAFA